MQRMVSPSIQNIDILVLEPLSGGGFIKHLSGLNLMITIACELWYLKYILDFVGFARTTRDNYDDNTIIASSIS